MLFIKYLIFHNNFKNEFIEYVKILQVNRNKVRNKTIVIALIIIKWL